MDNREQIQGAKQSSKIAKIVNLALSIPVIGLALNWALTETALAGGSTGPM